MANERTSRVGYALVLLGAAAFLLGTFLPLYRVVSSPTFKYLGGVPDVTDSMFHRSLHPLIQQGLIGKVADVTELLLGTLLIAWVGVVGIVRRARPAWLPIGLLIGAAIWSAEWANVLIQYGALREQDIHGLSTTMGIGYWLMVCGVTVVVVGTVLALISGRRVRLDAGPPSAEPSEPQPASV